MFRLKPFAKINEAAADAASVGVASAATGINVKSNRGSKRFMDNIKKGQAFSASMKPPIQKNMGVSFTPKTGPNAGEEVAFRMKGMPPILKDLTAKQEEKLNPAHKEAIKATFKRYSEDEDTGMLRMEELKPLNRMGAVPFQRNEMPMAYKHKVVKKTGTAKAIPFTAK